MRRSSVLPTSLVAVVLLGGAGCDDAPSCPAGTEGCACLGDGTCGGGLACEAEVCESCPEGALGCACFPNDTCDDGLACQGEPGACAEVACPAGTSGCPCLEDVCLEPDESCGTDGRCHPIECLTGTEGCPCTGEGGCGVSSLGETLVCRDDGLCGVDSCPPGTTGCACAGGTTCTASTDACSDGFCVPAGCAPGTLDCECLDGISCLAGLTCRDGAICVDGTGYLGGACYPDLTCERGLRCEEGECKVCTLGTLGCACTDTSTCLGDSACVAGLCWDASEAPPDDKPCYTHCERDLVDELGDLHDCSVEGLMSGCFNGRTCTEGSCLLPGEALPTCGSDIDCPDFQACLAGGCYSNCTSDVECTDGKACFRHVCRQPCTATGSSCPVDTACDLMDGDNGHCMPHVPTGGETAFGPTGGFEVTQKTLAFSNINTAATFQIVNDSSTYQTFIVRKRREATYSGGAMVLLDDVDDATPCDPATDACPLEWLRLGQAGTSTTAVPSFEIGVEAGDTVEIEVAGAGDFVGASWDGVLEVVNDELGTEQVDLGFTEVPEGRWTGNMVYLAQFGTRGLPLWRATQASRDNQEITEQVGNALVQKWGAFRRGDMSWAEMQAVLASTYTESWRWPSTQADCPYPEGACYPYEISTSGLVAYSTSLASSPVPSGVTELPLAMNLRQGSVDPRSLEGRIESSLSLQYPGNPAVTFTFLDDPSGWSREVIGGTRLTFVQDLHADVMIGGRYVSTTGGCTSRPDDSHYAPTSIPWLLPGFERATATAPGSLLRYRTECRDGLLPWASTDALSAERNRSLSGANPIPDGRTRRRTIGLIDGAFIDQTYLFLLFEETFESFLPGAPPFTSYGYVLLRRERTDLAGPEMFEGSPMADVRPEPTDLLDVECSQELVDRVLAYGATLDTTAEADSMVGALIDGVIPGGTPVFITATSGETVHYLCADTGQFDGGPGAVTDPLTAPPMENHDRCTSSTVELNFYDGNGSCDDGGPEADTSICPLGSDATDCPTRSATDADARVPCPVGSAVTFFTVDGSALTQAEIAGDACQSTGSCEARLAEWRGPAGDVIQVNPVWRCTSDTAVYCDDDRYDLRTGKTFYAASDPQAVMPRLLDEIDSAFRYRTRFRARDGDSPGFAPELCVPDSNQIPYCYDPPAIEAVRERLDCLLHIWKNYRASLPASTQAKLHDHLCLAFSYSGTLECNLQTPGGDHDGFERLYAELLVMMGDESFTRAFASRFDLAGTHAGSFEGALFEPGGINLSGTAGYEMTSLYRAAEYYQEALDRFYSLSPLLWASIGAAGTGGNFVTPETVTMYFERLARASTKKARVWSQVAERYQSFNRSELARSVIERAYAATYLESVIIGRLMLDVTEILRPEDRPQVAQVLEESQRRYRMAMLDMVNAYRKITDNISYFGLSPDYIPFPTLGPIDDSPFEVILARARAKANVADLREDEALARSIGFEVDAAQFQAELVRLRTNYEGQLGDLCGTFVTADDGRVLPAIAKYAYLEPTLARFGDPCGLAGNGAIYAALGQIEIAGIELDRARVAYDNVFAEVDIELSRVQAQCGLTLTHANYVYTRQGQVKNLREDILDSQNRVQRIIRVVANVGQSQEFIKCSIGTSTDCPSAVVAGAVFAAAAIEGELDIADLESDIVDKETEILQIERETARWETALACQAALVESNARTATLLLQIKTLDLDALRAEYQVRLAMAEVERLRNTGKRLEQEYEEAQQLSIDIVAARNDPNVRIYRDDAYINADRTFDDARREAYMATRVFEYYTSQSYAPLEQLFLMRMVQFGDYNLLSYLTQLENAYFEFEDTYGLADVRVARVSLRDDILRVPMSDEDAAAQTAGDRIAALRDRLTDPRSLDRDGYISIPFSTTVNDLSPLTRNHKVLYVKVNLSASEPGDDIARIYLEQAGTGVVHGLGGDKTYYRLPKRTAVINTMINGGETYGAEVYRNGRLRGRPFVNTGWRLILNQRDEVANQDINLASVDDIVLYIYYTDFTVL